MSGLEHLEAALIATGIPYAEEKYYGQNAKYIVYVEEDEQDRDYSDNSPQSVENFCQVHYFCPAQPIESDDSRNVTKTIKKQLRKQDFIITGTTRRKEDDDKRHVVISCKIKTKMEV